MVAQLIAEAERDMAKGGGADQGMGEYEQQVLGQSNALDNQLNAEMARLNGMMQNELN